MSNKKTYIQIIEDYYSKNLIPKDIYNYLQTDYYTARLLPQKEISKRINRIKEYRDLFVDINSLFYYYLNNMIEDYTFILNKK